MSISYSAINGRGKITLPSIEGWGTNMNILRDPPKSIMTRRINKVGDNNSITRTIDESDDRIMENVLKFARGVNPMVSVEYRNYGGNGGGITKTIQSQNGSAKLPYRIMRDGAFRPPILRQEQLLPLSRQSRNVTSCETNKQWLDFSKKLRTCGTAENTKEVFNSLRKISSRPTHKNIKNFGVTEIYDNMDTINIRESLKGEMNTNIKKTQHEGSYQSDRIAPESHIKENINTNNVETNKSVAKTSVNQNTWENEIILKQNRPTYDFTGSVARGMIGTGMDNSSREFKTLKPKVKAGGFHNYGVTPSSVRIEEGVRKTGIIANPMRIQSV